MRTDGRHLTQAGTGFRCFGCFRVRRGRCEIICPLSRLWATGLEVLKERVEVWVKSTAQGALNDQPKKTKSVCNGTFIAQPSYSALYWAYKHVHTKTTNLQRNYKEKKNTLKLLYTKGAFKTMWISRTQKRYPEVSLNLTQQGVTLAGLLQSTQRILIEVNIANISVPGALPWVRQIDRWCWHWESPHV